MAIEITSVASHRIMSINSPAPMPRTRAIFFLSLLFVMVKKMLQVMYIRPPSSITMTTNKMASLVIREC